MAWSRIRGLTREVASHLMQVGAADQKYHFASGVKDKTGLTWDVSLGVVCSSLLEVLACFD